uniref:Uncharacterized protein n=1 Tax=Anguilla anguilla TaxID=7936 RepID=A0A0E9PCM5_ANGAN
MTLKRPYSPNTISPNIKTTTVKKDTYCDTKAQN